MLPHQVKHHQIVLLRGLHILVEIIDQLHIVGERGVVARRVRQACDFGIVDEGVDGDGVEPLRHVGALHVPHPHIIAAVLEDGGEIRVVEPVFAIAHAVDAKGVFSTTEVTFSCATTSVKANRLPAACSRSIQGVVSVW